jgi:TolB-like protein/DNA-binding winged helix-turn-helix (wHTH) protein/Tfp pilus assembly protein PilF
VGCEFRIASWRIEPQLNTISRNGTRVRVEPKVMAVLVCLAEEAPDTVSRERLLQTVWPGIFVSDDVLTRCVSELRRVFEDDARESRIIQTIPKRGYRLVLPVESDDTETAEVAHPVEKKKHKREVWGVAFMAAVLVTIFVLAAERKRPPAQALPTQIHSLAVLPLENLSGNPSQEYFSDGITDGLITDLAHIQSIRVISRTSSMLYKQNKKTLPEIAQELGVDGIVEGTVQRSGSHVRVTAQLIFAPLDKHLWAETYERDMTDVFAIEAEITQQIARQVEAHVSPHPAPPTQTVNMNALETYLQGNYLLNRGGGDSEMRQAQNLFAQAITDNARYAPAYIGLAYSHYLLLRSTTEDRDQRRSAAEQAVALDPSSSDAHSALGEMKYADWEFGGAEDELRRAIALNSNNAKAHASLCQFLNAMARINESLAECQMAQQLDPDYDHLSQTMEVRGNFPEAIKLLEKSVQQHPTDAFLCYYLYRDYALNGDREKAIAALERSIRLVGLSQAAERVQAANRSGGYRAALTQYAGELEQLHASGTLFLPRLVAEVYAQIGDKERAFYWLEQGFREHARIGAYGGIDWMLVEHELDPLHSDVRWKDLIRRIGLPEQHS